MIESFLNTVVNDLSFHGGKIIFYKSKYIGKLKASGEFYIKNGKPFIAVSTFDGINEWIMILAHEYSHFNQWRRGSRLLEPAMNASAILENGICKENTHIIDDIINFEIEADMQTLKLIEKYKLPMTKDIYSKKSNIVLYKWLFFKQHMKWPFTNKNINAKLLEIVPSRLIDHLDTVPPDLEPIFLRCLK